MKATCNEVDLFASPMGKFYLFSFLFPNACIKVLHQDDIWEVSQEGIRHLLFRNYEDEIHKNFDSHLKSKYSTQIEKTPIKVEIVSSSPDATSPFITQKVAKSGGGREVLDKIESLPELMSPLIGWLCTHHNRIAKCSSHLHEGRLARHPNSHFSELNIFPLFFFLYPPPSLLRTTFLELDWKSTRCTPLPQTE
ncbi:hypothetical protein CEXT_13061 [Caerostris extrusa]|uniref:Uncharacterized protein n=1 Tax=Caerostris extrusa TaxID=172846 RepID=A0AAV4VA66_CAEEX|nr:hypothetical protein CEXT_13061 [Caerostris extrusa]